MRKNPPLEATDALSVSASDDLPVPAAPAMETNRRVPSAGLAARRVLVLLVLVAVFGSGVLMLWWVGPTLLLLLLLLLLLACTQASRMSSHAEASCWRSSSRPYKRPNLTNSNLCTEES